MPFNHAYHKWMGIVSELVRPIRDAGGWGGLVPVSRQIYMNVSVT